MNPYKGVKHKALEDGNVPERKFSVDGKYANDGDYGNSYESIVRKQKKKPRWHASNA